jgi:hypothetical protein
MGTYWELSKDQETRLVLKEPGDKTSVEGKKWKTVNSLLIGWLLNSVVPSIGRFVEGLSTGEDLIHPVLW